MSISREQFNFGHGSFVGQVMEEPEFFELSAQEQARITGWVDGCPVVEELIDPANTAPGRGPENMLARYAGLNFWFGYISREVRDQNPELYDQLMAPVARKDGEVVGKHEPKSVPSGYHDELYPMNTLAGYGLPRIFVEQLGSGDQTEVADRMIRGLQVVEGAIPEASSPMELLALIGEGLARDGDIAPEQVMKHTLSQGWIDEHNSDSTVDTFKDVLADSAPTVWAAYTDLDAEQRTLLKIA